MGAIDRPSIRLDVAHRDESVILGNLLNLYLHDLSPYTGATPGRDGRFAYPRFDAYWTAEGEAEGRVLLLITVEDELVGFVLKNRHSRLGQREQVSSVTGWAGLRQRPCSTGLRATGRSRTYVRTRPPTRSGSG